MTSPASSDAPAADFPPAVRPVRVWPGLVILALQGAAIAASQTGALNNFVRFGLMMLGPLVCGLLAIVWLVGFSRLRWLEGLALVAIAAALGAAAAMGMHESMGVYAWAYGVPLSILAAVATLAARREQSAGSSRVGLAAALLAGVWGALLAFRNDGVDGDYRPDLSWRWNATAEQRLVAAEATRPDAVGPASAEWEATTIEWPGFRGPGRNGVAPGTPTRLDWRPAPPRCAWRRPIGPGWGSVAVVSGRLFTQEQRGDEELVSCFDAATGDEVWRHAEPGRFSDVVSGAGPRATPHFNSGRVFALGAKGLLVALDAATGRRLWKRDFVAEWDAPVPQWGFSGSPLLVDDMAIVYAGGDEGHGLVAFDAATGEVRWKFASTGMNFSSAQLASFDDRPTVLFTDAAALHALDPSSGEELWRFDLPPSAGAPVVQPQPIGPRSVVVAQGDGIGLARVEVARDGDRWSATLGWSSTDLKPSFNDFVHLDGYLYGFDQNRLACVDAATGKRVWKGARYGFGQTLLLPDAESLLVTSERGEAVLVAADSAAPRELGRFPALEGKTWNHPVVVGDRLFVRNGEELACYRLAASGTEL